MRAIIIFTLHLLFCNSLFAQEFFFENLTFDEKSKDNRFNAFIYEDSYNFTWISSLSGVLIYDGCNITSKLIDSEKVSENIQSNFFEDSHANLWFSVYEGLICYNRKTNSFEVFQLKDEGGILIDYNYRVFHLDTTNEILWLRAGDAIFKFNISNKKDYNFISNSLGENFSVRMKDSCKIKTIISSTMGKTNYSEIFNIEDNALISSNKIAVTNPILSSLPISDSICLLIGENKIWEYNYSASTSFLLPNIPDTLKFYQAVLLGTNKVLLSTMNSGVWLYNMKLKKFTNSWILKSGTTHNLLSNQSFDLNLTKSNKIWISHYGEGLSYTSLVEKKFSAKKNITTNSIVYLKELNKNIIIGDAKSYTKKNNIKTNELTSTFFFDEERIWSMTDKDNNIFICTENEVFYIPLTNQSKFKVSGKIGTGLFRRFSKVYPNRIFLTTTLGMKEIKKSPTTEEYYIDDCPEFKDHQTFSFIQLFQSQHTLKTYVPYNATDLWVYQATPDSLRLITKLKTGLEFFGFTDSQKEAGTIWAGSAKGLIKITQDTVITRLMDKDEKLKNVAVYSVVEDKKGVLWLGTNQGLFQYFPDTRQTYQYEEIDGLPSRTFSLLNSAIMTDEGEIWMGTNKGVVRFNPDEVKPYSTPPNVYIDGLLINDTEPVKGIGERDSLHLTYEENTLLFDVKAIGYYKAKRNKINYRMQGYENDWVNIKNGQMIRYAKLPPGNYTLQVQAEDVNGNQSQIRDLEIFVRPPFWQTWWFYLSLSLTVVSAAFALYRYRVGLVRKEEEQKTAVANLNLQVVETEMKALKAQMNPHFLFNSMNSIKGLILKQNTRKASEYLTKFSVLLRSILANSEKRHILLAIELETLRLYIDLEALRFTREIDYQIETTPDIDIDFISIPPLVLQPFVENAIWHGLLPKKEGKNSLRLHIEREQDFIIYTIQDNGVGRAATTNHKKLSTHKSMGIGITRKRIELIHSENSVQIIDLHDKQGKATGTQVVLRIYEPE